jgi:hypothetical protein
VRRGGVGYFFGAYDAHGDGLFGGYRLAKTATEVLAFYKYIRRRYPDRLRIYLVNDNLSPHWTPPIRRVGGVPQRGTRGDAHVRQSSGIASSATSDRCASSC